jgi:hypothetical protein
MYPIGTQVMPYFSGLSSSDKAPLFRAISTKPSGYFSELECSIGYSLCSP